MYTLIANMLSNSVRTERESEKILNSDQKENNNSRQIDKTIFNQATR